MAITKLNLTSAVTGTLPTGNGGTGSTAATLPASLINNTSIGNITSLPSGVGGKVSQIVQAVNSTTFTSTSSSYSACGDQIAITPSASSSKILLMHSAPSQLYVDNTTNMAHIALFRDSTNITTLGHNNSYASYDKTNYKEGSGIMFLDSPSSTSELTYHMEFKSRLSNSSSINNTSGDDDSELVVMEVLA